MVVKIWANENSIYMSGTAKEVLEILKDWHNERLLVQLPKKGV